MPDHKVRIICENRIPSRYVQKPINLLIKFLKTKQNLLKTSSSFYRDSHTLAFLDKEAA